MSETKIYFRGDLSCIFNAIFFDMVEDSLNFGRKDKVGASVWNFVRYNDSTDAMPLKNWNFTSIKSSVICLTNKSYDLLFFGHLDFDNDL